MNTPQHFMYAALLQFKMRLKWEIVYKMIDYNNLSN
jgi:hypothetical protein